MSSRGLRTETFPKFTGTFFWKCSRVLLRFTGKFSLFMGTFSGCGQKFSRNSKGNCPFCTDILQNSSRALFRGSREKTLLSEGKTLSQNSDFVIHISTFLAENVTKSYHFKSKNNALPKQIVNNFQKVKKTVFESENEQNDPFRRPSYELKVWF